MLDFEAFKERYEKVPVEEYPNNVREAVPEPMVSVHLITYNHADYIKEAIESVLMQEVDFPMEIVLGDDDSSDGTREICIEYAEKYPNLIRLQLHHRENNIRLHGHPTHIFQYWYNMLSLRGKYFAILSGDDYWMDSEKLKRQANFLESNQEFALSFHDARVVDSEGKLIKESKIPNDNKKVMSESDLIKGPYLPALTLFGRNIFGEIPEEATSCLNEDRVTISISGRLGKGCYQKGVQPSVYRIRDEGIWSKSSPIKRAKENNNTSQKIFSMYSGDDYELIKCMVHNIFGSYVSLISRLFLVGNLWGGVRELLSAAVFLCRNGGPLKVILLVMRVARFVSGGIKQKVLGER